MKTSLLWILLIIYITDVNEVTGRANCPKPTLQYGRAKLKSKGRLVRYKCRKKFQLYGSKVAVCVSGKWSHQTPVCIANRCKDVVPNADVIIGKEMGGALLRFSCKPGLIIKGASEIYCQGRKWSDVVPSCYYREPEIACDFEKDDLCGWTQDTNDTSYFDWTRHSGQTSTDKTGPDQDHTYPGTSDGHYMYIETSRPRRKGHFARLLSPFYKSTTDGYCFDFWYHMKGPAARGRVGSLEVFVRGSNQSFDDLQVPKFSKSGNQGDSWLRGKFYLGEQKDIFQIVIVGTRGASYLSDIAIDDVRIYNCSDDEELQSTEDSTTAEVSTPIIISSTENLVSTAVDSNLDKTSSKIEPSTVPLKQRLTTTSIISTQFGTNFEEHTTLIQTSKPDNSNTPMTTNVPIPKLTSSRQNDQTSTQILLELSTAETTEISSLFNLTSKPPETTTVYSTTETPVKNQTKDSKYLTTKPTTNDSKALTTTTTTDSKALTTMSTTNDSKALTTISTTDSKALTTKPTTNDSKALTTISTTDSKALTTVSTTNDSKALTTMSITNISKELTTFSTTNGSKLMTTLSKTDSKPLTTLSTTNYSTKVSKTMSTLHTTILSKQNVTTEGVLSKFTTTMAQAQTSSPQVLTKKHTSNTTTEQISPKNSAISSTIVPTTTVRITKPPTFPQTTDKATYTTLTTYVSQISSKATKVPSLSNLSTTKRKRPLISTSVYTRSTYGSSPKHSTSTSATYMSTTLQRSSVMPTAKTKLNTISSTKPNNEENEIPDGKKQKDNTTNADYDADNISTTELPNIILIGRQKTDTDALVQPLVIGLGVGVAIGLIIVLAIIFLWIRRKRRKEAEFEDEMTPITKSSSHEW